MSEDYIRGMLKAAHQTQIQSPATTTVSKPPPQKSAGPETTQSRGHSESRHGGHCIDLLVNMASSTIGRPPIEGRSSRQGAGRESGSRSRYDSGDRREAAGARSRSRDRQSTTYRSSRGDHRYQSRGSNRGTGYQPYRGRDRNNNTPYRAGDNWRKRSRSSSRGREEEKRRDRRRTPPSSAMAPAAVPSADDRVDRLAKTVEALAAVVAAQSAAKPNIR